MLLTRWVVLYLMTTTILLWLIYWCVPFKFKITSKCTTSYYVSGLNSRYSLSLLGHYDIIYCRQPLLHIFIIASVLTWICSLFSSSSMRPIYKYTGGKEFLILITIGFFIRSIQIRNKYQIWKKVAVYWDFSKAGRLALPPRSRFYCLVSGPKASGPAVIWDEWGNQNLINFFKLS